MTMLPTEKYGELAKKQLLYDFQAGDDVSCMLAQHSTNSRINEAMAQWCMSVSPVFANFKGAYRDLLGDIEGSLQRHFLNMDGYGREQAIAMRGASALAENAQAQKQKKGGLLGMIGGT